MQFSSSYQRAADLIADLEKEISSDEREEGQRLARAWLEKHHGK